jgi:hypothetical protein
MYMLGPWHTQAGSILGEFSSQPEYQSVKSITLRLQLHKITRLNPVSTSSSSALRLAAEHCKIIRATGNCYFARTVFDDFEVELNFSVIGKTRPAVLSLLELEDLKELEGSES